MDPIAEKLESIQWHFAESDPKALADLKRRIAETGGRLQLITYSANRSISM
jgi:hypothetical protein